MGFFDMFKKKSEPAAPAGPLVVAADARGTVVKMEDIPDEVFAQGILGPCCGIDPEVGEVFAPLDGEITQAPDTLHALGILGDNGVEVLIHVGVDTVERKGEGFTSSVKLGDKVRKGQKLLTTVITNGDDFASTELAASGTVEPGAELFRISKN